MAGSVVSFRVYSSYPQAPNLKPETSMIAPMLYPGTLVPDNDFRHAPPRKARPPYFIHFASFIPRNREMNIGPPSVVSGFDRHGMSAGFMWLHSSSYTVQRCAKTADDSLFSDT